MLNKILRSPITTVVLFAMAAVLLLTGTIGGARAAELIRTEQNYKASLQLSNIGVQVTENGNPVDALFQNLVDAENGERFVIGKDYTDTLAVQNSGDINEYVRVTITRYWEKPDGTKLPELDPELIQLKLGDVLLNYQSREFAGGWLVDTESSTDESIVLYYDGLLVPGDEKAFLDTLTVSGEVLTSITRAGADVNYDYENVTFHVEAVADAVQENNAGKAIPAAWGSNFLGVSD